MTAESVATHYNAQPNTGLEERTQSRIYHLRNFNNWMKSMLIADFLDKLKEEGCSSATVLDLCCGKGGDLLKWKIGNIKKIVMTDIAEVALDHCRTRYSQLLDRFTRERRTPFEAHFVVADSSKDDLMASSAIPDGELQFDICSCQFALHYSFESEEKARRLLWNATRALRPGGYFIGTLPDANMIVRFLRKSDNGTFKNDVCQIDFEDKSQPFDENFGPPLFGAKLNFALDEVVNCPEYLAYFPLVVKILEEFGMKLVYKLSFPDAMQHYLERDERKAKSLMAKMTALEAFPASGNNVKLSGGESEYDHARRKLEFLDENERDRKIGTLSKSEWEVVSMYLVFAFVKG